jgi:hypothetical protein
MEFLSRNVYRSRALPYSVADADIHARTAWHGR